MSGAFVAVAWALTGEEMADSDAATGPEIAAELEVRGWDHARVDAVRQQAQEAGERWPFPMLPQLRGDAGAAQVAALIQATKVEMELGPQRRVRDRSVPLTPHDRALIADVPPHHGLVG